MSTTRNGQHEPQGTRRATARPPAGGSNECPECGLPRGGLLQCGACRLREYSGYLAWLESR